MMLLSVLIPALFSCYFVSAIEPAPSFDLRGVDGNSPSGCKCVRVYSFKNMYTNNINPHHRLPQIPVGRQFPLGMR
jgi:hypothetical protein